MKCEICNLEVNGLKGLSIHLKKKHKYSDLDLKDYYDKYLKKETEGKCYFCGEEAIFLNFTKGYHRICKSKECLGKTRATGTIDFLKYKYDLNDVDAKNMQDERSKSRGQQIKKSFDKIYETDKDFHKKRSHNTKEFWLNKGFSEEESIKKSEEVMCMIHEKTFKKFKDNPEKYDDIRTSQLKYWLKKGNSYDEAKEKLKNRQSTNIIENYIKKYGLEKGIINFNKRKIDWSKNIEQQYTDGKFSKVSKSNYSKPELELIETLVFRLELKNFYSGLNENQFFRRFNEKTYSYDFVVGKKIIEFNGDYWHCNPLIYDEDFFHNHRQMYAKEIWNFDKTKISLIQNEGYSVLVIWENEYKQNTENTIQKCIDFLKK